MKTSIILATYNWPQALDLCLTHLTPQILKHPDIELIIADDGSGIETTQIINKYQVILKNQIKHVWHEDNGFQKSLILNKAVTASKGHYLIFLDSDCIPFDDYIQQQLALAQSGYFVAGNRVLLSKLFTEQTLQRSPSSIQVILKWSPFKWICSYLKKQTNKLLPWLRLKTTAKWRYARSLNWKYPKGCNFAVWKNDFIQINGFDHSFSGWGHEDADLFIRLIHHGIKVKDGRFSIPVLHLWHKESSRFNEVINYQKLMERVADKNFVKAVSGLYRSF